VSRFEAERLRSAASLDVLDADPPRALFSCRRWESLRELRPNLWRLLSSSGTGDRLLPRSPATAPRAALARVRSASPKDQNRPAVPSRRGAISSRARRWRNDSRRLPSCRTPCLPPQHRAAFHPRGPDASSAPGRVMCRAFPVTFVPDTLAPLRSGAGVWFQRLCAFGPSPRGALPRALLAAPLRMKRSCRPPRQRIEAVRERLARPPAAYLATGRGARARCVRPTSASQCFDYEYPCLVSLPASLRGSRLAPSPEACAADDGDRGTWRFKPPDPLRWIDPGWRAACCSARSRDDRTLWHPCREPACPDALAREEPCESAEAVLRERSVKIRPLRRPGMPSIDSSPRACADRASVEAVT